MRNESSIIEARTETLAREAMRRLIAFICISGSAIAFASVPANAGEAKGTIAYKGGSVPILVTIKHAYLVKGPDVASGETIRRVVLSVTDVTSKLSACATMSCSDGGVTEGMTIDFDAGPRLNYWFVANGQMVQYSGTAEPAALKLTIDAPQRLAGEWDHDDTAAGGPRVQIEFDASLVKEITKP